MFILIRQVWLGGIMLVQFGLAALLLAALGAVLMQFGYSYMQASQRIEKWRIKHRLEGTLEGDPDDLRMQRIYFWAYAAFYVLFCGALVWMGGVALHMDVGWQVIYATLILLAMIVFVNGDDLGPSGWQGVMAWTIVGSLVLIMLDSSEGSALIVPGWIIPLP